MFDVPVYWPILVVYFFVLFLLTMRRQIQYVSSPVLSLLSAGVLVVCGVWNLDLRLLTCSRCTFRHMIKYKYVPFDIGRKTRYGGQR